jgi:acetyl-CoA C-acetyltransferase
MVEANTPVIVGVAQYTNRSDDLADALEPVDMMALVARRAEEDAGATGLLERLDSLRVVNVMAWRYEDAVGLLAERLGIRPVDRLYSPMGGSSPQWLVNETAQHVAEGRVHGALLVGGDAVHTVRRARRQEVTLPWTPRAKIPSVAEETERSLRDIETRHRCSLPVQIYPMFENALRAHKGRSIAEHQERLGDLCARMAAVARDNPYAWFRDSKSKEDIVREGPSNRMVGFPYTKYMNAIIDVDQAAAVIMTSAAFAREMGIPEERWVYPWAGADAVDLWYITDRVNYWSSLAIERAGQRLLAAADLSIDDIDCFDLYSCFPSAVETARDMLGIAEDDPRPVTLTGGLPYAGGPGSNYSMHAIAAMVDVLRREREKKGLVTAMGWYLTKHSLGVYGGVPREGGWQRPDMSRDQAELDAMPHPGLAEAAEGPATIETYTVMHDRAGKPEYGFVIGRLEDGRRFISGLEPDPSMLRGMTEEEAVGARGRVRYDAASGLNTFSL